jgi:hypothetical protein
MDSRLDVHWTGGRRYGGAGLAWVVVLGAVLLASAGPALGQFKVDPMKIDLQVRLGWLTKSVIHIQSLDPNQTHVIDLSLVDLTKDEKTGAWQIIAPNSNFDRTTLASCKDALRLSNSTVTVRPQQTIPVELTLRVPRSSPAFSYAGIVASLRPRTDGASNVGSALRFMVPVFVRLQNPPTRDKVRKEEGFVRLFAEDGVPEGWLVRSWSDVSKPVDPTAKWTVKNGILNGSTRGTWLISKREYSDFILKFDFKLGTHGNSGCALRAPLSGDPAFDGMELQMADYRYNTSAKDSELTGGIYRAIAPLKQVYKPTKWNSYAVYLKGSHLHVTLNGVVIHDLNLNEQDQVVLRHNGRPAPTVKDRPRKGHIGFQELSRGEGHVQIRNARLKVLNKPSESEPD